MLSSKFIESVWYVGLQIIFHANALKKKSIRKLGFIFFIFKVPQQAKQKNLSFKSKKCVVF